MKKLTGYILTSLLVVYFVFAGTGYNIVKYCCGECERHGVEYLAHYSCETESHSGEPGSCCEMAPEHGLSHDLQGEFFQKNCSLFRVSLDQFQVMNHNPVRDIYDMNTFPVLIIKALLLPEPEDLPLLSYFNPPDDWPSTSGRNILAFKSVLII